MLWSSGIFLFSCFLFFKDMLMMVGMLGLSNGTHFHVVRAGNVWEMSFNFTIKLTNFGIIDKTFLLYHLKVL